MKIIFFLASMWLLSISVNALEERSAGKGTINRMIVNHHGTHTYITVNDSSAACSSVTLQESNPNIDAISHNQLFAYLLAAKLADKKVELYTGLTNCLLFRAEILD